MKQFNFFILSSFFFLSSYSQTTTNSPYSIFGLGDLETPAFSPSIAMGHSRYSLAFPYSINIANPASYGFLPLPAFDAGFTSNFLSLSYGDSSKKVNTTYFKNLALAFPVSKKWWAFSFGIVPYSKMGYSISSNATVDNFGTVKYTYKGSGGINRFFVGNAFNILKDSVQQFSIGANISYLFGSLVKTSRVIPESSLLSYNTKIQSTTTVGDFFFDAGVIYTKKVKNNWNVSLGADYEFGGKLKASNITLVESYTGSDLSETIKDTLALDSLSQSINLPWKAGAGISVLYKGQWLFAADYSLQDWSGLDYFGKNAGLAKQQQYSLGVQYNYNARERENILKMMWYRAGFRYASSPVEVKNRQLREYGITFGVGIPVGEKTKGSFNLSLETGIRGENENDLIAERFTNIVFGFSFTPSYFDRWFVKPKID